MQPNFRLQSISFLSYFLRLAKIRIFASLCLGICGTSLAHNIKAMMTCLSPCYQIQYNGRISPIKIIYLQIKLRFTLIPWLLPQFHNINWKQPCNTCMNKLTILSRIRLIYSIQIVVRFFVDHRIKQHTSLLVSETV